LIQPFNERHVVETFAIKPDRHAMLKLDLNIEWLVGSFCRVRRPGKSIRRRLVPRVFEHPCFATSAPKILIDAVRAFFGRFDWYPVPGCELDLLVAGHLPLPHWSDDLQIRCQGLEGDIKTHLIVAFTCTAVRDRFRLVIAGGIDHELSDER